MRGTALRTIFILICIVFLVSHLAPLALDSVLFFSSYFLCLSVSLHFFVLSLFFFTLSLSRSFFSPLSAS